MRAGGWKMVGTVGLGVVLCPPPAAAAALPAPEVNVRVFTGGTVDAVEGGFQDYRTAYLTGAGSLSQIVPIVADVGSLATAWALARVSNVGPSIYASVAADKEGDSSSNAQVNGSYTYAFQVYGPASEHVAVTWNAYAAYAAARVDYGTSAAADLRVNDLTNGNTLLYAGLDWTYAGYIQYGFTPTLERGQAIGRAIAGTGTLIVKGGDILQVVLSTRAYVGLGEGVGAFETDGVTSYIDPVFAIAATDPNAADFSLRFDDDVTQADDMPIVAPPDPSVLSAAPESSTWAMMILGFGLLGSTLRRAAAPPRRRSCAGAYPLTR